MSRLIDADKLLYNDIDCEDGHTYMVVHAPEIDRQPTIEVPQWIPCSERLPEYEECFRIPCYVTMKYKDENKTLDSDYVFVREVLFRYNRWMWENGRDVSSKFEIIAWKKIEKPQPYRKES